MLAFNQTKHDLSWSLSGQKYSCEAWGSVDLPEELWLASKRLGLPLDVSPVPPEHRAKVQVEDERKASDESALFALKARAEAAEAEARATKGEIERVKTELSESQGKVKHFAKESERILGLLNAALVEKVTAEKLMDEANKRATEAEAKVIKADSLLSEARKPRAEKRAG